MIILCPPDPASHDSLFKSYLHAPTLSNVPWTLEISLALFTGSVENQPYTGLPLLTFTPSIFQVLSSGSKLGSANQIPFIRFQRPDRVSAIFLPLLAVAAVKKGHKNIRSPYISIPGFIFSSLGLMKGGFLLLRKATMKASETMARLWGRDAFFLQIVQESQPTSSFSLYNDLLNTYFHVANLFSDSYTYSDIHRNLT